MKKKYRRAVCKTLLLGIVLPIYRVFYYPATWIWRFTNWLKIKMRVQDGDPD